ncbi:MAG: alpha/beta hydrolase [Kiloniellales bacterium]
MTQLILLPGLLNDAELWRDEIAALSPLVDCRVGDLTRGETMAALVDDVLAVAEPTFALAGFSFGGYVALQVLARAPERVERLALIGTSAHADGPARQAQRRALDQAARQPGRFTGIGERMLASYVAPARLGDRELAERVQAMTRRLGRDVFLRQNAVERPDGEAARRAVPRPVLILCGEHDVIRPPAEHRDMAGMAPDAELIVVPDAGHLVPMERPLDVAEAMRRWLSRPPRDFP